MQAGIDNALNMQRMFNESKRSWHARLLVNWDNQGQIELVLHPKNSIEIEHPVARFIFNPDGTYVKYNYN